MKWGAEKCVFNIFFAKVIPLQFEPLLLSNAHTKCLAKCLAKCSKHTLRNN